MICNELLLVLARRIPEILKFFWDCFKITIMFYLFLYFPQVNFPCLVKPDHVPLIMNQVPLSLAKYIGTGAGVSLPTKELFRSLVNTLLIPLILGKVCSYSYLCTPLHCLCSVISIQCIVSLCAYFSYFTFKFCS